MEMEIEASSTSHCNNVQWVHYASRPSCGGEKNRISLVDLEHNHMASRHGGPG